MVLAVAALIVSQYWLGVVPNFATWLLVIAIVQFVIQPLSTLLHELGHAGAVSLLGRRQSFVMVGRGPWLTVKRGRVMVHFSVFATRGVRIAGVCRFDRSGLSWKQLGWIALAGPLATAAQLILVLAMAPLLWTHGPTIRYLVVLWTIGLASSLVINLVPQRGKQPSDHATVTRRDGTQAREAFARHRAGAPPLQPIRAEAAPDPEDDLPPHWAPADPDKRRVFEAELRRALLPPQPGEDPAERRRLETQLRAALTPPDETYRQLKSITQQRDRERSETSTPTALHQTHRLRTGSRHTARAGPGHKQVCQHADWTWCSLCSSGHEEPPMARECNPS
ncbi:MAG: site-2 protease family protein [Solirubrobacteraceae bacterium]